MNLKDEAEDLASGESSLRADVGSPEVRIRLLELTLADSVRLTQSLTTMLLKHDTYLDTLVVQTSDYQLTALRDRVTELESKLENARLYGFSRSADDD